MQTSQLLLPMWVLCYQTISRPFSWHYFFSGLITSSAFWVHLRGFKQKIAMTWRPTVAQSLRILFMWIELYFHDDLHMHHLRTYERAWHSIAILQSTWPWASLSWKPTGRLIPCLPYPSLRRYYEYLILASSISILGSSPSLHRKMRANVVAVPHQINRRAIKAQEYSMKRNPSHHKRSLKV